MDKRVLIYLTGVIVAAALFAVDILFPILFDGGVPYFALVILAWWSPRRGDAWLFAGLAGFLTILGHFFPVGDAPVGGELNRAVALAVIGAVSVLMSYCKNMAEELRRSGEVFRSHFNDDPVPIYSWRRVGDDFVLADFNNAAREITSGAVAGFIGHSVDKILTNIPESREYLERCVRTKSILRRTDNRIAFPSSEDGEERHLDLVYVYVPPESVMVYTLDVTEKIEAEKALREMNEQLERRVAGRTEELARLNSDLQKEIAGRKDAEIVLRESEERYRTLVEQSPEAVLVHYGKEIIFSNQAALELFGASGMDEMLRTDPFDLIREQDKSAIIERRRKVMEEGQVFADAETILKRIDGTEFFADRFFASVLWDGRPAFQLVIRDITLRKQAEMALRDAKEAAERANSSKSRFLAAASHDLRQPIQALNLFVHSLGRKTEGNVEIEELVGNIRLSSEVMSGLLNALLDISKLDAGMVDPEIEDFPVEAALDDVSNTFFQQAREKNIDLRVVMSSAIVKSDPALVRRVIYNYVSNAVRYTDSGRILLGCRKAGDKLRMEVWDTGPGIPESEQAQIFEEFYQLKNPARDRSRGLGLGLAIVKRTVDLLGLETGLRSVPGKGSMFWVAAPLSTERALMMPETVPSQATNINSGKIVLIEDDAIVLRGLEEMLLGAGYDVIAAENAQEAVDRLRKQSGSPDLIVADHRLGAEATGIDAIDLLHIQFGEGVPAIIITGDTAPDRLREASDGGHVLLHKPVMPELLLNTVARVLLQRDNLALSG